MDIARRHTRHGVPEQASNGKLREPELRRSRCERMPKRVYCYFFKSSACAYARENPRQADEMSVATVRGKNPLAVFVMRLRGYVLRGDRADGTQLWAALCVFKTNAAGFCVQPSPGQCEDFAAAASGQQ